jgi:hypothetical protein
MRTQVNKVHNRSSGPNETAKSSQAAALGTIAEQDRSRENKGTKPRRGKPSPAAEPNVSADPFCGENPATPP